MPDLQMNLGRRPEFDRRNLNFLGQEVELGQGKPIAWHHWGSISDQNGYGGCVGWTGLDWRNTEPAKVFGAQYHNEDGLEYYNGATRFDQWTDNDRAPGLTGYTPDMGSSGQGLAKYFKAQGYIDGYEWADNINRFIGMIQRGPLACGMEWTQDMFNPDSQGRVRPTGAVAGGHEIEATRLRWFQAHPLNSQVWFPNHWTNKWGKRGWFYITVEDMIEQYKRGMDVVLMIPKGQSI